MADEPVEFGSGWFHTPEFVRDGLVTDDPSDPADNRSDPAEEQAMFGVHTPVWGGPPTQGKVEAPFDQSSAQGEPAPAEQSAPEQSAPEPAPPPNQEPPPVLTVAFAGEEIAGVLRAAQEAAQRMLERAKAAAESQMADAARRRQELLDEAAHVSAMREEVSSVVRSMASEIDEFRAGVEDIPRLLSEAFAPLAERIPAMQRDLAALAGALGAPLAPTQTTSEEREQIAG